MSELILYSGGRLCIVPTFSVCLSVRQPFLGISFDVVRGAENIDFGFEATS